jgi:hypothetical protein
VYFIFKPQSPTQFSGIERLGQFMQYIVASIPESNKHRLDIENYNATVITEGEAKAIPFVTVGWQGFVNVRQGSALDQIGSTDIFSSLEPNDDTKVTYFLTDDDIINTASLMRRFMRLMLNEYYDLKYTELNLETGALEVATWNQQKLEADAFIADNTASVPMLQALATARGISKLEMANKIITANESYNTSVSSLLSSRQTVEQEIKICDDIRKCNELLHRRFNIAAPMPQREQDDITVDAAFDL